MNEEETFIQATRHVADAMLQISFAQEKLRKVGNKGGVDKLADVKVELMDLWDHLKDVSKFLGDAEPSEVGRDWSSDW